MLDLKRGRRVYKGEGEEKKNEIFIIRRDISRSEREDRDSTTPSSNFPSSGKTSIKVAQVHSPMGGCLADESLMDTMDLSGTCLIRQRLIRAAPPPRRGRIPVVYRSSNRPRFLLLRLILPLPNSPLGFKFKSKFELKLKHLPSSLSRIKRTS